MHCFGLAVTVHKNVTTAEVEIWTHDTVDNKMFLVFLKKNLSLNKLKALLVCAVTLVPVKGHYQTISSTFSPANAKHKACLRSCHRKRHISREQVPFLFSKMIPMACRTASCTLGSFHHLKHLAAL